MSKAPLAAYPALRPRRLRQADWVRRLVRETDVSPSDLIWSMVVHDGADARIPVASMPGVDRLSVNEAASAAVQARELGIPAIAVFPYIDGEKKDARGSIAVAERQSYIGKIRDLCKMCAQEWVAQQGEG